MSIIHKNSIKGHKSVDTTMIAMARCIASFVCYMRARKSDSIISEYSLRTPIMEIAQTYQWNHQAEFRLTKNSSSKKGAKKKIDHVFAYNNQVIAIELKFPKRNNLNFNIDKDIKKITQQFPQEDNILLFPCKYGFVIVVYEECLSKQIHCPNLPVKAQYSDEDMLSTGRIYKKKNIITVNEKFTTKCNMGNTCYCVDIFKVLEKHNSTAK